MLGNIRFGNTVTNSSMNATRAFECHPGGEAHGKLLLGLASAGVAANLSLTALIMARKALRRWSSGLLIHGTVVDGARAGLLIPLSLSVLRCQPVTRCSVIDTAFLLLATVSSLNLLTASLSDAPLLPPPVVVPSLLQSVGFQRPKPHQNHFASPLYPKGDRFSYYSDYYEEDANLLAETTAMPDSPQCVLFGSFMVWFAALTINLGPTFLSGAMAAQAEVSTRSPSCPLVRGPARHIILNILWSSVNLLCVALAASQLRKLKRDLARARLGQFAAAGAGLAGLAGIAPPSSGLAYNPRSNSNNLSASSHPNASSSFLNAQKSNDVQSSSQPAPTQSEVDNFLRLAQRNGRSHIRTLGTLAVINLICWVPLYVVALLAPVGTGVWEDPVPHVYEVTLLMAFSHSFLHPIFLIFLHQPLRDGLRRCFWESCCCFCNCLGMELGIEDTDPPSPIHTRDYEKSDGDGGGGQGGLPSNDIHSNSAGGRAGSYSHLHSNTIESSLGGSTRNSRSAESLSAKMKRTPPAPLKNARSLVGFGHSLSPSMEDILPPPPLPPASSAFRKQLSMEERSPPSPMMDNRW